MAQQGDLEVSWNLGSDIHDDYRAEIKILLTLLQALSAP